MKGPFLAQNSGHHILHSGGRYDSYLQLPVFEL